MNYLLSLPVPEILGGFIGLFILPRWPIRTGIACAVLLIWAIIFPQGYPC
jgi:hypothetical protein